MKKECKHNGSLTINKQKHSFTFFASSFRNQCAVLYEIFEDKTTREQLLLSTQKYDDSDKVMITLMKEDYLLRPIEVLKISLKTAHFSINSSKERTEFKETLQIFGEYSFSSDGGVVEVLFTYNNGNTYCVIVNPVSEVFEVHKRLCDAWPHKAKYLEYCICLNNDIVGKDQTFANYYTNGPINFTVTELCTLIPITKDSCDISVPWNNKSLVMIKLLSIKLKVDSKTINLIDNNGNYIIDKISLDKEKFRCSIRNDSQTIQLFYEIEGAKIICTSMKEEGESVELMLFEEKTVKEVKRRLEKYMNVDERRYIIFNNNLILANSENISIYENLRYCVGLCEDDIEIKERKGFGISGVVYRCNYKPSMEEFALKKFKGSNDLKMQSDLIQELIVMCTLKPHDNIIKYLDIYVNGNDISISMEYMSQGSLRDYLVKHRALNEDVIKRISKDICKGLKYLHDNHILHRDIKSLNVLMGENEVCKLCDFGVSKFLPQNSTQELSSGIVLTADRGSYRWMAPEVINNQKYSKRSDIWSVGATVVEMITGKLPHHELDENAALNKVSEERVIDYTPPHPLSEDLQQFVDSCLKSEAKDRLRVSDLLSVPFLSN